MDWPGPDLWAKAEHKQIGQGQTCGPKQNISKLNHVHRTVHLKLSVVITAYVLAVMLCVLKRFYMYLKVCVCYVFVVSLIPYAQ